MAQTKKWRWIEEQPGVVVAVVLILAMALLYPQDACQGSPSSAAQPIEQAEPTPGGDS